MLKGFKFLVLILLLVVLPAGSYLYLKKGYDFRKGIMSDLSKMEPIKNVLISEDSVQVSYRGKCTLIALTENETTNQIYNQFKDAKGFQMIAKENLNLNQKFKAKNYGEEKQRMYFELDSTLISQLVKQYKSDYILLDSLGNVRRTYADEKEELRKMVIHISALLPYYDEKKGR